MNEKFIPLYRKYRPQTLEEIVGQEHVKKALTNAINLKKIAHAYLFTGPRGTGKTSTARILAKSLNCINGPTVKPCGKCASCVDITNSTPLDVIEIDAASNRSVNDAQNILEKIQYAPVNGKYKIYIIDEVHMLTKEAFNALLKTLEEPPENVIFILATTEVHKVLDTIKSRCQRFDFKRITTNDITEHLKYIAKLEKINIEDDAILTIAKNAAGGMRDSLALLDQLSVLDTQKAITTDDINLLLGRLSFDTLNSLSESIINSNPNNAIEILEEIYNNGNEPSQILLNLLNYFKNILIVKNCKSELVLDLTQTTEQQIELLKKQAEKLETQQITFLIERTSHYINELKTTTNQHIWLEIAMIDLANLAENSKLSEIQNRLMKLEQSTTEPSSVHNYKTPPHPVQKPSMKPAGGIQPVMNKKTEFEKPKEQIPEQVQKEEFSPMPVVQTSQNGNINELWKDLLTNINYAPTRQLLLQMGRPVTITAENITITVKTEGFVKKLNEDATKQLIIEAANNLFNQTNSNVIIRLPQSSDNQISTEPPTELKVTTDKTDNIEKKESKYDIEEENIDDNAKAIKSKIEDTALSDQVKMVKNLFDGKIVNN